MSARRRARGFTLIEVLVSVFLLSVLSAFAYETLSYVRRSREATNASFERIRAIELAMHYLVTDFQQLEPRPVRDLLGQSALPAILADPRTTNLVTLTRGGWPNPAGLPRGTLQRVNYRLDNGTLIREYQTVLDATLSNTPVTRELLKDVVKVGIRYMDSSRVWQEQWPPLASGPGGPTVPLRMRPMAVEIVIELRDAGRLTRLVEVPS
ncbi:MAG TPA: type II secretion system minor pseudopilin GspJ [Steroidobacteraceae bacterium]|nr:type II secretion system minor pseudopilin GspJ [Steroidobacteraceae bacterium]